LPGLSVRWLMVENVDLVQLLMFIMVHAFLLFSYEALPEELVLRGYA
jgi:hypothetical protein